MANLITVARVILVFIVIAVWGRDRTVDSGWLDLAMVPLLAWAIYMDPARKADAPQGDT